MWGIMFVDFEEAIWKLDLAWRKTKTTFNIKSKNNSYYLLHYELLISWYIYDFLFIKVIATNGHMTCRV
jgi:hypothetical protein